LERPEDGDGLLIDPPRFFNKPQEIYNPASVNNYPHGPRAFGGVGYRPATRERRSPEHNMGRVNNMRNGLQ